MIETILGQMYYQFQLSWWERWQNVKFLTMVTLIILGFSKKRKTTVNTFYNLWDLPAFGREIRKLIFFHNKMARVILDPKHKGIKAWEYGLLLTSVSFKKGMKVLDVGSGGSVLPLYLAEKGVEVTAFDLEEPMETPRIVYDQGSMLDLPYKDSSFDLVLSISAIEHLDYLPSKEKTISYSLFTKHAQKALSEMVRVLKPKGKLFLTSDVYFPNLQFTDRWPQTFLHKGIGTAFKKDDFERIFVDSLERCGWKFIGKVDYDFNSIINNADRSNYRGRYFTTFAIYAKKEA